MEVKEFLHSKSMLTPGLAGCVIMLITNALQTQFELPSKWVALVLSFLLGSLVFADVATKLFPRIVLYLINSLIIFSIAVGAHTAGRAATEVDGAAMFPTEEYVRPFFAPWFENG